MSKEKLNNLIDKVIGKDGPLRVPAYWMNKLLKDVAEWVSKNEGNIAAVDSKVDETKTSIPTKVSQLENDAEYATVDQLPIHFDHIIWDGTDYIRIKPFINNIYFGYIANGRLVFSTDAGNRFTFFAFLDENSNLEWELGPTNNFAEGIKELAIYKLSIDCLVYPYRVFKLEKMNSYSVFSFMTYVNSADTPKIKLASNSSVKCYYNGEDLGNLLEHEPNTIGEHTYLIFTAGTRFSYLSQLSKVVSSISDIEFEMFKSCKNLISVKLPNVKSISYKAFQDCSNLSEVDLGTNLKNVSSDVFSGCDSLPVYDSISYAGTVLVKAVDLTLRTYRVKDGTKLIAHSAFNGCSNAVEFIIPPSVSYIDGFAFRYSAIETLKLHEGVTFTGNGVFDNCKNLTHITLPSSVTIIPSYTFRDCSNLATVVFLGDVSSIEYDAFPYHSKLGVIKFEGSTSVPTLASGEFSGYKDAINIIVPDLLYDDWVVATNWAVYADRIIKKSDWDAQNATE